MTTTTTLKAGTVLYHGTAEPDFEEADDDLDGPAWLTDSPAVAERFARRNASGPDSRPRVLSYTLEVDVELHLIRSKADTTALEEEHGISFFGVEEMRDTVVNSGIPGWVIPNNYPEGADILIVDTGVLRYMKTTVLDEPLQAPTQARGMRPR
jgi:hypothetical protein